MGVLQRFERRLEGLVEGAFARTFGGVVQPVEVAARLQREAADHKTIVGAGRVLVPNDYDVELSTHDHERLAEYDEALTAELADMVREHADEQGWSFVGTVRVHLVRIDDLDTGVFRVRSRVHAEQQPAAPAAVPVQGSPALEVKGERHPLGPVTVIGRGAEADLKVSDTGVSRRHAEITLHPDGSAELLDLQSTNGTSVNGAKALRATLADGDAIGVGATVLVFRAGG
ncbi:MAG: DUF3662 and FHA domain-containing protein [Mycobacteriales bacterium]|nr:DUF3662 and FHA domain-containing protein [Mycobacteriales bacterium]